MPVARGFGLLRLFAMTGLDVFLYFLVFVILGKVLKGVFSPLQSIEIASPSARNDLLGDGDCLFTLLRSFFSQ